MDNQETEVKQSIGDSAAFAIAASTTLMVGISALLLLHRIVMAIADQTLRIVITWTGVSLVAVLIVITLAASEYLWNKITGRL